METFWSIAPFAAVALVALWAGIRQTRQARPKGALIDRIGDPAAKAAATTPAEVRAAYGAAGEHGCGPHL